MMKQRLATCIATFFYSGLFPKAPGTAGSLAAICVFILAMPFLSQALLGLIAVLGYVIGIWASRVYMDTTGKHDPGEIVIDEAVGIAITLMIIHPFLNNSSGGFYSSEAFIAYILAFISFRFFDILKPWPISYCDKEIKGAHGVMLDDVVAGIFAGIFSYFTLYLAFKYGYEIVSLSF